MLAVVGGTYKEQCVDPFFDELWGSALRGAAALANFVSPIQLFSCIGETDLSSAEGQCSIFNITSNYTLLENTVSFNYFHPLTRPTIDFLPDDDINLPDVTADNILMYGQVEGRVKVKGKYVVYDPQSWISFTDTKSEADHLALVLNRNEALLLSEMSIHDDLVDVGKCLCKKEGAEVVVIKNSTKGALVIEAEEACVIPLYETDRVWPIGSGDIFSAVFAFKWAVQKLPAKTAALEASKYTAHYCQTKTLPLPAEPLSLNELTPATSNKKVYLAGPFFTTAERWILEDIRSKLIEYGADVFSPLHDVGLFNDDPFIIAEKDLTGLIDSDVVFAIADGLDAGTLFEIGYARALNKKVVVLAQNVSKENLVMLVGSNCEVTDDLSTAVYKSIW